MGEVILFPAPALPVSGSKGMFSARNIKAPHCDFRCKCKYFLLFTPKLTANQQKKTEYHF